MTSGQPCLCPQLRKALSQLCELEDDDLKVIAFRVQMRPVHPAGLIVLTIGIVVAVLAVADFIACKDEGNSMGEHERGQQILPQPATRGDYDLVACMAFHTEICAVIVVLSVAISFKSL